MININNISQYYFIGIGGIGMSALARYFKRQGKEVSGYDKTPSPITHALQAEGIEITFEPTLSAIPEVYKNNTSTCVIYTPAIPGDNILLVWFNKNNFPVFKRSQILGELSKQFTCLAVAGTHGKTTTSSILAHLLVECGMKITAFLGGIAENFQSNFVFTGNDIMVVEADEFDRSFLQLHPDVACVTSIDADHLDVYENASDMEETFKEFSNLLEDKNKLVHKNGLPFNGKTVAVDQPADFQAINTRIEEGHYVFDLVTPNQTIKNLRFGLPGHHNLFNAVTALGMAIIAGTPTHCLPKALYEFKGVERRFSYKLKTPRHVLIDDYAHHPTEIEALFQAVTEMYPNEEKLIVFQPHLFSRTRDFADGFAQRLAQFDEVMLLDIYPAREKPIKGITSQKLVDKINKLKHKNALPAKVVVREELGKLVKQSGCRIKLMVGAGNIGEEVEKIKQLLIND